MNATCKMDIGELAEFLADKKDYSTCNGATISRPDCPAFIFRDERRRPDIVTGYGRDLALDFEEYIARRNHEEALDKRIESGKAIHKDGKYVSDEFNPPTPQDVLDYLERQDARGLCNWLIDNARRRAPTNDHWRKLVAPLADKLSDPILGVTAKTVLQTLAKALPFAPGPIKGTTFVNPDGSKYKTAGTDYGKARGSFITRHKINEEFVSADRVQYEGERGSQIVVGIRRSSADTPSRYYDPNPTWQDERNQEGYMPNAAACLVQIRDSLVMPSGSHRLTVREFERALIAGADLIEDDFETTALELEEEYLPDARVLMIETGYGKTQRDAMALSHEEEYLYSVLGRFAKDADDSFWKDAQELVMLGAQEQDTLCSHFRGEKGLPSENLIELLRFVAWDDKNNSAERAPYLPYVLSVLSES